MKTLQLSDFDYYLPPGLIAQVPRARRQDSRLMVIDRQKGLIEHRKFTDLKDYFTEGDALVLNNTRVIPARIFGYKVPTGGQVEVLLVMPVNSYTWQVLLRPGRGLREGTIIKFGCGLEAKFRPSTPGQLHMLEFNRTKKEILKLIRKIGLYPVPPYIKRKTQDKEKFKELIELDRRRYQTVYAKEDGAIAAPTAGLHFNRQMLKQLEANGIRILYLTLHVGYGTFRPLRPEDLEKKKLHAEFYHIPISVIRAINQVKNSGGRITVVGTTTCRALETAALESIKRTNSGLKKTDNNNCCSSGYTFTLLEKDFEGWTDLFIYPPFEFGVTDRLLTNFHLPRSSLLMLICAFCGDELWRQAYEQAIEQRYLFYSYGDAMLIC